MKRKKRRSAKRRAASRRRRSYRRRSNPMFAMTAPRRRHRRHRSSGHRRRGRSRNPGLGSFTRGGMLQTIGGAAVGFFGSNALPALVPQLAQYNAGITGYAIQAGSGLAISWALKRFVGTSWGTGALVGTGLSILMRMIKDHAMTTGSVASAAMSGDLAYYAGDRFPFPQGDGGPYAMFPGNPSLANPPFPATSSAAVRAGQAAAAAALPAHAMHGIPSRWGTNDTGTATRWM